ncbi:acryloyl-CoA reductase electron transfer subunit beta [bacterium BMS3Abin02]|nr:acryloyl-CoA reductase electron transfer subunit beta [bacterium BMS3Abin02]GBE22455.1 acryloyl-CoA reductase electron transfer subunit beta [bacterium BMS3Bbin01]HDH25240.1 electron transfer flavoprotein subunit alpha/FixB family protein [Actinomycetota bacterium]
MKVWVFVEESQGNPAQIGLEMLSKARSLAGSRAAVYLGTGSEEIFGLLGSHGAQTVYQMIPDNHLPTAAAAAAIADLAGAEQPDVIMFGLTPTDRDIAGRLSARMGRPVISNVTDVVVDGDTFKVVNEVFGGTEIIETAFLAEKPHLVVVRPKSFPPEPTEASTPDVVPVALPDVGAAGTAIITDVHVEEREGPQLEEASIVVSAGRGLGSAEHLDLTRRLADLLGGAMGATRAVVDAGWVPYSFQVGQTGKTVKPDVYIACGISGAMQHVVGMKDSKVIIAINKDEEAPIFGLSDLGVVGDVHKVLPKLIEALEAREH